MAVSELERGREDVLSCGYERPEDAKNAAVVVRAGVIMSVGHFVSKPRGNGTDCSHRTCGGVAWRTLSRGVKSRCQISNSSCSRRASFQWAILKASEAYFWWRGSMRLPSRHNDARAWDLLLLMPGGSGVVKGKGIQCILSSGSLVPEIGTQGGHGRRLLLWKLKVWCLSKSAPRYGSPASVATTHP